MNVSQTYNITMKEEATELKEVVVKAPAIYQHGDTLSYNLSSYITQSDYTLKDALKKLPGIDVEESGNIKYLGKEISNFYIDGLDLLGGKYNIATTNIPASFVNSVQVLNNHQTVNMNKDIFSDDVAININMSNNARFKPIGTYEGSVGYGDDWQYKVCGAGMLFKLKFQTIATLKIGNIQSFASNEVTSLFGGVEEESKAEKLIPNSRDNKVFVFLILVHPRSPQGKVSALIRKSLEPLVEVQFEVGASHPAIVVRPETALLAGENLSRNTLDRTNDEASAK